MTLAPKTFGAEVGDGMAALANSWVSTQNTLQQQRLAQQQQEAAFALQQQQAAQQASYQNASLAQNQQQLDQQAARDQAALAQTGGNKRSTDFQNVIAPTYNGELQSLGDAIKQYGPSAGASFNPAVYDHAMTRMKQLKKLMGAVSLTTASGEGYDDARAALLNFVGAQDEGGNVHPAPSTATPGGQAQAAPAALPQIDMRFDPAARRDALVNGAPAPQAAPAPVASPAAVTSDLSRYATIQDVPPSVLMNADNAALIQQFGNGSDIWAGNARSAYRAAQAAQEKSILEGQAKFLQAAATKILDDPKHPATPKQLNAARIVSAYAGQPLLTADQSQELKQAIIDMAPNAMNSVSWGDVLASKDPATILATLPMYQKLAPEVVQGFDPTPYQTQMTADLDAKAASTAKDQSQTVLNDANTNTEDALRPGKVDAQTDTHNESVVGQAATVATTAGTVATTGKTLGDTAATKATTQRNDREAGIKNLTDTFATLDPKLSYYQIGLQMPGLIASTKAALGLTDTGMNNLIREAQYKYGQGIRATDLANQLAGSKVLTDGATRAGIIASTADTLSTTRARDSKLQPELNLLNQQIRNAELQGQDTASLIARRNALLPIDVQEGLARAAASRASAASSSASAQKTLTLLPIEAARGWADIGNIQSQVHARNVQTNQVIAAQQGKLDLTQATIAHLGAQTLYERTRTPGDPLYNPAVAAVKPGDPQAALYKQIDQYVKASKTASGLVGTLQNQINAISKKYTTALGTVDLSRITPEDKASLATLTRQRDHQVAVATNRQRAADDLLLKNPPAGPAVPTQPQKISMGLPAAQTWASQHPEVPGVASDCAAIAGQYLNDLGLKIAPSNASAGLEANAKKGGWKPTPIAGIQRGDLVVWTGAKYGLQKVGGVGKHVGVVADVVNGVPQILMNPGLLPDGTQGTTKIVPMSDQGAATAYRAPSGTKAPPASATPPAVAKPAVTPGAPLPTTPAAPRPAAKPAVDTSMPAGITPVESVKPLTGKLKAAGWFASAAKVTTAEQASASLDQAVKIMNPSATPEQIQVMKRDLARTMGW